MTNARRFGFAAILVSLAACGGSGSDGSGSDGGASTTSPGSDGGMSGGHDGTGCGSGGGGPTGGPGDLFPCDNPWYADVTGTAIASDSSAITSAIGEWGTGKFMIDFSIVFMHANASTPRHAFTIDYADESESDAVPIPAIGSLEGETGYTCTQGGDCHLLVIDDSAHKLFELWSVAHADGTYVAEQESVWDLTKHYGPDERGLGCTSADAAGLAITPGLIGVRETKAGEIHHALRFILPNAKIRKGPSFVAPASHGTSATSSDGGPAYGTRLRLRSSFDESSIASAGGKAVVRALKRYGMILADGGNIALVGEDDKLEKAVDPALTWDGLLDAHDLAAITPADFDVLDHGAVESSKDCTLLN